MHLIPLSSGRGTLLLGGLCISLHPRTTVQCPSKLLSCCVSFLIKIKTPRLVGFKALPVLAFPKLPVLVLLFTQQGFAQEHGLCFAVDSRKSELLNGWRTGVG